jgi:hypothetical protein
MQPRLWQNRGQRQRRQGAQSSFSGFYDRTRFMASFRPVPSAGTGSSPACAFRRASRRSVRPVCNRDRLESRVCADRFHDVANVVAHRLGAQVELLGDLGRRPTPLE